MVQSAAMVKVEQTIEAPVPRPVFYRMITDYRSYPEFVSGLYSARILESEGRRTVVEFSAHLLRDFTYQLELLEQPPDRLEWRLVEGPLRAMEGSWELVEVEDTDGQLRTRASYRLGVEAGFAVPKFALRLAFKVWMPRLLEDYRERARQLARLEA